MRALSFLLSVRTLVGLQNQHNANVFLCRMFTLLVKFHTLFPPELLELQLGVG